MNTEADRGPQGLPLILQNMADLRTQLEPYFAPDTRAPGYEGTVGSAGHCAAVALIVNTMYLGELVSTTVQGRSHWYSLIHVDGKQFWVDLTGDQFGYPAVQVDITPLYPGTRTRFFGEVDDEILLRAAKLAERAGFFSAARLLIGAYRERDLMAARKHCAETWVPGILNELERAYTKFPRKQASLHEGFAVLKEEVDELWDAVKGQSGQERDKAVQDEAIQVAAMAVRLLIDAFGDPPKEKIPGATIGERVRLIEQMLAEIETVTNEIERGVATNPFRRIRDALFRARYNLEEIFGGEE